MPRDRRKGHFSDREMALRIAALLSLVFVTPASASTTRAAGIIERGTVEVAASGAAAIRVDRPNDLPTWSIQRSIGFFLTQAFELGLGLGLASDFRSEPATVGEAFARHNSSVRKFAPFLGVHARLAANIFGADPRVREGLGCHFGIRYFLRDSFSANVEARYTGPVQGFDRGEAAIMIGVSVFRRPETDTE